MQPKKGSSSVRIPPITVVNRIAIVHITPNVAEGSI